MTTTLDQLAKGDILNDDAARDEKIIEACKQIDPSNGEATAHLLITALDSALEEWMEWSQYDAAKQWLLTTMQSVASASKNMTADGGGA